MIQNEATQALVDGMVWAVRIIGPKACAWCSDRDGQVLPIWDVINGIADHKYGQCSWLFLGVDDPLLDDSVVKSVDGVDMLVIYDADDEG